MSDPAAIRILRKRRTRRIAFVWLLAAIFIAGNLWDWIGGHSWGPVQHTDQGIWVHASAALFWLAVAMLSLCLRDLISFVVHRSPPPTINDLPDEPGLWNRRVANPTRRFATHHHGLIGLAGLFAGGVLGHFLWKP